MKHRFNRVSSMQAICCIQRRPRTYREWVVDSLDHNGKVQVVQFVFHLDLGQSDRHGNTALHRFRMI